MNGDLGYSTLQRGQDGSYRWVYEMNLFTNPTVLLLILKIFWWICFGIWVFMLFIDWISGDMDVDTFLSITKVMGLMTVLFLILSVVGYYVYTLIVGGKYCVLFVMDEKGILHRQINKEVKKAKLIGIITALSGVATANLTTTGMGLQTMVNTEMYSEFDKVRSVEVRRRRNVIKVNSPLNYNQVYASDADFEIVLDYILKHLPANAKVKGA